MRTAATTAAHDSSAPNARTTATAAVTLTVTAACWVITIWQMHGMNMGVSTQLGPFGFFVAIWVTMMAAMMLPGAIPEIARATYGGRLAPWLFVASYLAVWAVVGVVIYALYRPHGTVAAGVITILAGVYELTALKGYFRRRCSDRIRSGLSFGLYCVGSSLGLMLMLVMLGFMSLTSMAVLTLLVSVQKLLPTRAAIDVPVALAIIGFGAVILVAPSAVPGLLPAM